MSTTIQIRLPEDLKASLQARADAECRTLSNLVRQVVEQSHYEYLVRSKVEAARHGPRVSQSEVEARLAAKFDRGLGELV